MPKAAYALSWSTTSQTYVLSGPYSDEAHSIATDSPAWFAWLAERSSFAFHGQAGSYTARLETVQRGEHYWFAYQRNRKKLCKKYLGKTTELSIARLEQIARLLHAAETTDMQPLSHVSTGLRQAETTHHTAASNTRGHVATVAPAVEREQQGQETLPHDPFNPLLVTKLHVPRLPARLVRRARLIKRLQQGLLQGLLLLSAPAGFGKTTLLTEFLDESGMPAAWLSLDVEDNDPARFLSTLLASLQTIDPTLGTSVRTLLSTPHGLQGLSLSAVFALLLNDLASRETREFLLVLDDYHVIMSEPIQQAMAFLVEHCPPKLHLIIATRADPLLPLSRLRARGQLCELRTPDLQFDATEASHFLHTTLERDLEDLTIATIHSRTEGWIGGLQLTALLLQGRRTEAEVRQVLADSLGSHRYLVDYLVEEVLARQPEIVQSFLLHTSVLDRLSAPLCAVVSGVSAGESEAMLSSLERANLFLVPLDEGRDWYRYHQLWASVLQMLLLRQLGKPGVAALYARASRWYEQHDMPSEAIEAAFKANEFERATYLVEQLSVLLLTRDQYYTLRHWIERLPEDLWMARPIVCLAYAWTLFLSGAHDAYATYLQEADRLFRRDANHMGMGMVEVLRAVAALMWAEGRQALTSGREALALLPEGNVFLRGLSMSAVAGGYWLTGDVEAAWLTLMEARTLHERTGDVAGLLINTTLLGHVLASQGKLHEAANLYQQVIDNAIERQSSSIDATIRLATLCYEWNALEMAEAHLARAIDSAPAFATRSLLGRGVLSLAYITQARILQARGEHEEASTLFTQAVTLAYQQRHMRFLALSQAAQVRWWLSQGQMEAVIRWREGWARTHDAAPTYEDEPGALTLARVLIAQGEPGEALRLLDDFRAHAKTQGRLASELEILVLSALAENALGRTTQAVQTLQLALVLAEPEGYVRLFVDEGIPIATLLRLVLSRRKSPRGAAYVNKLLTILQSEHSGQADRLPSIPVKLSGRERTILHLLATGRSTPEMAAELVVSPNTIKTQISSLYRKLDAHNREEALAEATRLHLL